MRATVRSYSDVAIGTALTSHIRCRPDGRPSEYARTFRYPICRWLGTSSCSDRQRLLEIQSRMAVAVSIFLNLCRRPCPAGRFTKQFEETQSFRGPYPELWPHDETPYGLQVDKVRPSCQFACRIKICADSRQSFVFYDAINGSSLTACARKSSTVRTRNGRFLRVG